VKSKRIQSPVPAKLSTPVSRLECFSLQQTLAARIESRSIDSAKLKLKRFPARFHRDAFQPSRRANVEAAAADNVKARLSAVRANRYKPKLTTQRATKQPKGSLQIVLIDDSSFWIFELDSTNNYKFARCFWQSANVTLAFCFPLS
jgi:hypothetical protein